MYPIKMTPGKAPGRGDSHYKIYRDSDGGLLFHYFYDDKDNAFGLFSDGSFGSHHMIRPELVPVKILQIIYEDIE